MYINSNVTAEEFFRDFCTDENAVRFWQDSQNDLEIQDSVIADQELQIDKLSEDKEELQSVIKNILSMLGDKDEIELHDSILDMLHERKIKL